jgi:hypothetical protein
MYQYDTLNIFTDLTIWRIQVLFSEYSPNKKDYETKFKNFFKYYGGNDNDSHNFLGMHQNN